MKILLADDSSTMRLIQVNMLKSFGYTDIIQVDCGTDVISCLKTHPNVKLILLDWNMPLMDGLDCLKAIRSNEATKAIPVVMVTSEATKSRIMEAIHAGANNYLVKPFDAEKLKSTIDAAMKQHP